LLPESTVPTAPTFWEKQETETSGRKKILVKVSPEENREFLCQISIFGRTGVE
jgi:hypothetical protein